MNLKEAATKIKTEKDVEEFRGHVAIEIERLKEKVSLIGVDIRELLKLEKQARAPEDKMIRKTEKK